MRREWDLLGRLGLAAGLERARRQTSAGPRTSTLAGLGSALFLLVGELGTLDGVLLVNATDADPD